MENNITKNDYSKVKLSVEDTYIERMSIAVCILLIVGSFLKVMFF